LIEFFGQHGRPFVDILADRGQLLAEFIRGKCDAMWRDLRERIPGATLNGHAERRLPANLNIGFDGIAALDLIEAAPDIAISTGSACTSDEVEPSYVLRALGLANDKAGASIRIGLGRFTTEAEVGFAVEHLAQTVARLRAGAAA